jgi:membrane-bound lytic murein transglycosylase B
MKKLSLKLRVVSVIVVGLFVLHGTVNAQSADAVAKRQAELQAELDATNKDIAYWAKILEGKQNETASISRDIDILNAQIAEAKATIRAKNIIAQQLGKDIGKKAVVIDDLTKKLDRQLEYLAELVRRSNEMESYSLAEVLLSGKNFSQFFVDLDSFKAINESLNETLQEVKEIKSQTETEKEELSKKQAAEIDARKSAEAQQRIIQKNEKEKQALLAINKNQEKTYQGILADRQKRAAQIRSALFSLRDTAAIPFGTAFNYALEVQKKTGVRPAFLLAILTQETNLGENVGQCLVTNLTNGDGVGKNTGKAIKGVMKPGRDVTPFVDLANRLGFDPKTKPVSCPQPGGYGGAMGPSQFIPSTWALYEKKISAMSGVLIPDPWIPHDAFFATGIYLADLGAGKGGYSAESTAAAKYYAGSAWKTRGKSYANSVMTHAQNIQENMIDPLQNL